MKLKKAHIVMKLKNSNCDESQKLKLWWNSKLKITNGDTTQRLKLWQNSKTQIVGQKTQKLKMSLTWNCDKTRELKLNTKSQKLKLWQN